MTRFAHCFLFGIYQKNPLHPFSISHNIPIFRRWPGRVFWAKLFPRWRYQRVLQELHGVLGWMPRRALYSYLDINMPVLCHREDPGGGHQEEVCAVQLHVEGDISIERVLEATGIPQLPQAAVKLEHLQADEARSVTCSVLAFHMQCYCFDSSQWRQTKWTTQSTTNQSKPLRETNTYLHSFGSAQGGSFSFIGVSWKSTVTWLQVFKATWPTAADIPAGWRLHHNLQCRRCTALYHAILHPRNNSVQTEHQTGYKRQQE